MSHEIFMQRALELAAKGIGLVEPNPMVGCVIVVDGKIIAEGFHHVFGGPHAEVVAIQKVEDKSLLLRATLYVTLEPCAHHGKTPPCADLIVSCGIPKVVIACRDPFEAVNGKGIDRLTAAGIEVITGVLEKEARHLNRRFFTFHTQKRPYILLKWAQSLDGFIDQKRLHETDLPARVSGDESRVLVHRWRTEEMAIMVGKNTALLDNPQLTAREYFGRQPVRIVLDKHLELPKNLKLFSNETKTIIVNKKRHDDEGHLLYRIIDWDNMLPSLLDLLYRMNILSVLVEGGAYTLNALIESGYWDESRVFFAPLRLVEGTKAPDFRFAADETHACGEDRLLISFHQLHA
jgi:diaminohydroxyphosphoribosylaminopyrimidine deaminase/5-amino-6-(5-phosphoribosylamino)uracil reductase